MKQRTKFREIALLALPVIALGGVAAWLQNGGNFHLPSPNIKGAVAAARRPSLSLEKVTVAWISPTQATLGGSAEAGALVTAHVPASVSTGHIRPANPPSFQSTDVTDQSGRSIKATLGKKITLSNGTTYSGIMTGGSWSSESKEAVPDTTYRISARVPYAHLPQGTQSADFRGTIGWGTATPIKVKAEVLPAWMRRKAARIALQSATWSPGESGTGGEVRVECQLQNPKNFRVYGANNGLITTSDGLGLGYAPDEWGVDEAAPKGDLLLAEWSQRVESGDGKINSLDLLNAHIEKELSKVQARGINIFEPTKHLASFAPLCLAPTFTIRGNQLILRYPINSVPAKYKAPIFRCELYLVGDGMLRVRCPLKTGKGLAHGAQFRN